VQRQQWRVAVVHVRASEERAARGDEIDDGLIGLEDGLAFVLGQAIAEASGVVDVTSLVEAITRTGVEVVSAVGRRGVDSPGSLIGGDVVGEDAEDGAIEKRMLECDAFHLRAFEGRNGNGGFKIAAFADRGGQGLGDDVDLALLLQGNVVEVGMEGDGERRGQRPGRGGPDDGGDPFAGERGMDGSGSLVRS